MLSIGEPELAGIRRARAAARARAWSAGATPDRVVLEFDATPITSHSEKELAAGHYKGGFGFHPLLVTCGRETLVGILRPGNAGANNASDHVRALDLALEQLPQRALDGVIIARADSAGASHVSPRHAASATSSSRSAMASMSRPEQRSSICPRAPGYRLSTPTGSPATAPGSPS
jgi:hypothetical protein